MIEYFFVDYHNDKARNFWHTRLTTISCRVESTKKGCAEPFRNNIIAFIYNENLDRLKQMGFRLYKRDHDIIYKTFEFDRSDLSNRKRYENAMVLACMDKSEIWDVLSLDYIGSTRVRGYEKEIFYLKCIMNELNPAFILRCLYFMSPVEPLNPVIKEPSFHDRIRYLIDNIYLPIKINNSSTTYRFK